MNESKIFNTLFPVAIICTTIIVILFSRGWRLDFQEKTVVSTGILDVISEPKGATIYIDGEKNGKTPTVIDSLLPGKYKLELRKDLYSSWSKEIEIKEEYVTKIEANLFEEENELSQISDTPLENIFFSENGNEAVVVNMHNGDQGVWKTQLNETFFQLERSKFKICNLVETNKFDLLTSEYELLPNKIFSKAILHITKEDVQRTFLLDLLRENVEIVEITEFVPSSENYQWLNDNKTIALESEQKLKTFNTVTKGLSIISNWEVSSWTSSEDFLYFINTNTHNNEPSLYRSLLDGTERESFNIEGLIFTEIKEINLNQEYNTLIISSTNETQNYNIRKKTLNNLFDLETKVISSSPNERFFLFEKNTKEPQIYVYDFEEEETTEFTNNFGVSPSEFTWTPNSLKLFYRYTSEDNENKIISMDYDGTNFYEILNTPNYKGAFVSEFGFSADSKEVYLPLPVNKKEENTELIEVWEEYIFKLQLR